MGGLDKSIVVGVKDRATNRITAAVLPHNDTETLQGFVQRHTRPSARI